MTRSALLSRQGFTLLEIILALIIAGIVGAMLIPFLGTAVMRSGDAVNSAQKHAQLNAVMENITADFKKLSATDANPLTTLAGNIGSEGSDMNNAYGAYRVVTNHLVSFPDGSSVTEAADASGKNLKVKISYQGYTLAAIFTK
jgi:prepilin-type N-terminal cleavage/methylation domain-containing protein